MDNARIPLSRTAGVDLLARIGVVGVILVGLTLSTGLAGTVIAVSVGLAWWLAPGYFAFGFGQVAVVATHAGLGGPGGLIAQIGLWGLLAAGLTSGARTRVRAIRDVGLGSLVALVGVWGLGTAFDPLWQVALAFGVLSAGGFYAIHRYQLVRMGLVGETT